jgi:iron complex transport system ATP-binding protein
MDLSFEALSLTLRGRPILKGISGHLKQGQVTAILGANGAGKSSLLACLSGVRAADAGLVRLGSQALSGMPSIERARAIGLLPQQADIHWDVNVRSLVGLGRLPHQGRWGGHPDDAAAIEAAMAQTDCLDLADRKALRLSGGEQARVLLARVLAGRPEWILADEPLANLDPAYQIDVMNCFKAAAAKGTGVALVLHDLTQAARIADHVIIMKAGSIIASGAAADILTADHLAEAFGVKVHIGTDDYGAPIIAAVERFH